MDLSELRTELQDRGFQHLSDTRLDRYVNIGYSEATAQARWPFLQGVAIGTSPVSISDLGTVESVEHTSDGRKLTPRDRRDLTDEYPGLPDTGTALYYVIGNGTVDVYPADTTSTFTVRYWRRPVALEDDADVPVIPAEWQYVIVDYAAAKAYMDNGDADQAQAARLEGDRTVAFMVEQLVDAQADGASSWVPLDGVDC